LPSAHLLRASGAVSPERACTVDLTGRSDDTVGSCLEMTANVCDVESGCRGNFF